MSLLMSLQILDHPTTKFSSGDVIVEEATPGGKVFVLKQGSVKVTLQGKEITETSTPGQFFGEIASLKGRNYGATVTATSDCEFFIIDNFISYLKQNPEDSITILRTLCDRITDMNQNFTNS